VPVLISHLPGEGQAFQQAATQMHDLSSSGVRKPILNHKLPVFELRKRSKAAAPQISIGRAEENDVVVADETVSSRHAIFFLEGSLKKPMLQDLESTNGTVVNGFSLLPGRAAELKDGDVVAFGDMVFLFFTPGGLWDELRKLFQYQAQERP
jgi:pSer/pThr/pTyr-binding forkhead associated (FHA) protein